MPATDMLLLMRCVVNAGAAALGFRTVQTQPATLGCRADVHDLTPGTHYTFQVYAVNSQGASPASNLGQSPSAWVHAVTMPCYAHTLFTTRQQCTQQRTSITSLTGSCFDAFMEVRPACF